VSFAAAAYALSFSIKAVDAFFLMHGYYPNQSFDVTEFVGGHLLNVVLSLTVCVVAWHVRKEPK
jgi:hypothetical protein